MKNKLKKIIQHALDAFHKTTGLTIQHQPQYKDGDLYPDGIIHIAHKKKGFKTLEPHFAGKCNPITGVVGPDKFYVSNDHRYNAGFMQVLENYLQLKLSNVIYYDGSQFMEVAGGIGYANGINVSADGKILYLCAVTEYSLHIYDRDIASGKLTLRQKVDLGTGVDNIEMNANGGMWIGAHPQLLKFIQHAQDPSRLSPSQVLQLIPQTDGSYDIQEIYLNKGEEISASSVAAVYKNRMLIGAVFDPKFWTVIGKIVQTYT